MKQEKATAAAIGRNVAVEAQAIARTCVKLAFIKGRAVRLEKAIAAAIAKSAEGKTDEITSGPLSIQRPEAEIGLRGNHFPIALQFLSQADRLRLISELYARFTLLGLFRKNAISNNVNTFVSLGKAVMI